MNNTKSDNFLKPLTVVSVVKSIAALCKPRRIYLYNQRINSRQVTTSFKLCIVADVEDKFAAERDIYREIDCDIPFDILIYTPEEWEELTANDNSFAHKISKSGTVVYDG